MAASFAGGISGFLRNNWRALTEDNITLRKAITIARSLESGRFDKKCSEVFSRCLKNQGFELITDNECVELTYKNHGKLNVGEYYLPTHIVCPECQNELKDTFESQICESCGKETKLVQP